MIGHRYSQHARGALSRARALAKQCAHAYLDSTHLLLGILYEEGSVGCNILHDLQFDLRRTERAFRQLPRAADWTTTPDTTAGLQDALFQAARESNGLGQKYVGTEHLLLGMIRQGETLFMSMLHTLDVNPEQIRRRVQRLVQAGITEIDFEQAKRIARLSELSRRVLYGAEQMASSLVPVAPGFRISYLCWPRTTQRLRPDSERASAGIRQPWKPTWRRWPPRSRLSLPWMT
jgi:ATP-dependent Clp protease ATP-binding subunit ClpA